MSQHVCARCGIILKTGDKVKLLVYSFYQELKSKVAWSIEKPYDADEDSLTHQDCPIGRND